MIFAKMMVAIGALLAAGSALASTRDYSVRLARVESHAAEPTRSVRLMGIQSFEPLGNERLLLWDTPSLAYLLKLDNGCNDLTTAQAISVKHQSPWLNAGFDRIVLRDRSMITPQECKILEIRIVDVKTMKAQDRAAREAAKKP